MSYSLMLSPLCPARDSLWATWLLINIEPGDVAAGGIYLRGGGPPAGQVDLSLVSRLVTLSSEDHPGDSAAHGLAQSMELVAFTWDEQDLLARLSDITGNGLVDLDDLERRGLPELRPVPSAADLPVEFAITVRYRPSHPENHRRSDVLACTFTLALHHQRHQPREVAAVPGEAKQGRRGSR